MLRRLIEGRRSLPSGMTVLEAGVRFWRLPQADVGGIAIGSASALLTVPGGYSRFTDADRVAEERRGRSR